MQDLEQIFRAYRHTKIAVYGLSPLSETLLTQLSKYQIVGLLDGYQTEGALYGKPIVTIEKAIQSGVQLIIIAARPESCKVIAKRIGNTCKEHGVLVLDIYGKDMCTPKKAAYEFADIPGVTKAQIAKQIAKHDIVSVDLFDTLLIRRTLFPTDVFEIVGLRLRQDGVDIENFAQKRLEAEKELCRRTVPTLSEIYEYIKNKYDIKGISIEKLEKLEWSVDCDLLISRKEVCSLLREVYQQGKPVYITTDTFYTKKEIARFLKQCEIDYYTDILTSCDYRTSKNQRLFQVLRKKVPGKRCIHIGDSEDADVNSAEANGFTGCRIYSGLDLFEQVGYLGLWEQLNSLSSRIQAGMFVAQLFNSPFQFEETDRKIHVDCAYEIGYLFFAPVICGFMTWLCSKIKNCGLQNVWFSARDGYLIQKLYNQLDDHVNSVYLLTSRMAAIRAATENESDIRYVEEMHFSGNLQDQLRERFGIDIESVDIQDRLMDYKEEILKRARSNRKCYQAYLQGLPMVDGDVAFFDFVARGTVQMYVNRMTERRLKGFYFLQQDVEYMRRFSLDIEAFYQKDGTSGIAGNYYILETVLTSPEPSVYGFTEQGEALYGEETRTKQDIGCIQLVQDGIYDYFQIYRKLCPEGYMLENKKLGELLLSLIHNVELRDTRFCQLKAEDPFFNRTTDVLDLL